VISKQTSFEELLKAACEYWNEDPGEYSLFNELDAELSSY